MRFFSSIRCIAASAALITLSSAIAIPESGSPGLVKRTNQCDESSFSDSTGDGSPYFFDCLQLRNNLANDGSWNVVQWEERTLAQFGQCKFVAMAEKTPLRIGNEDIRDLIFDSVSKFNKNGKVEAHGHASCQFDINPGWKGGLHWWLKHS